jgi:hypothetical protein
MALARCSAGNVMLPKCYSEGAEPRVGVSYPEDTVVAKQMPTDHVQHCQFWLESSVTGLSLLRFE